MSTSADPEPADGSPFGPRLPVRVRVLAAVLSMAVLAMAVAGGVAFLIQWGLLHRSINEALFQEVAEFEILATDGIDPATGQPFSDVERLLRVSLQWNVPDRHETLLTVLNGEPLEFDGGDRPIRLETEPAVMAAVARSTLEDGVTLQDIQTSAGEARVAIIPVGVAGGNTSGRYVIAYAMALERAELARLGRVYVTVAAVSLLVVAVVGWLVAGRLLGPLRVLRESTERISATDITERIPVRGNDDISALTETYNEMLDRLQQAIDTQRRFLDDAGHELRTPLTIIRGHLEVLEPADAADVADTRALLLDETDRMSRMVEDLIILSKARRPDFLVVGEIDAASFTEELLSKVRGLGDRRWEVSAAGSGTFVGDSQRLTQAVMELANNAVKYSPPDSQIKIGTSLTDDQVRIWVADSGPGIPQEELQHVFDRFHRGSPGRGVEGSGLGLSIVQAITEAHGGTVEATSELGLGLGSVFRIVIPRGIQADPEEGAIL